MNLIKIFTLYFSSFTNAQMLVGSQHDEHNCVTDGGYSCVKLHLVVLDLGKLLVQN